MTDGPRVTPFLMFQGEASAALDLYLALFPDAALNEIERHGPGGARGEGTISRATLTLGGQRLLCFDSPVDHAFGFTPAAPLWVECGSEEELRRLADGLGEGGEALMPVGDYGFSRLFAWVADRFGLTWQLNLAAA